MTIPQERYHAVIFTEDFLKRLMGLQSELGAPPLKRIPEEVKQAARRLLRHYPTKTEAKWAFLPEEKA